jgi:hypothetical protein
MAFDRRKHANIMHAIAQRSPNLLPKADNETCETFVHVAFSTTVSSAPVRLRCGSVYARLGLGCFFTTSQGQ